jgi:TetR/AcrR family transcriptional regulator
MMTENEQAMASRGPRWQRKKEIRPQEILDAAAELFVEQGYAATRVSQIAKRAGVTAGTLYVYYKNKEAILQEVIMKTINTVFDDSDAILKTYSGSAEGLLAILIQKWFAAVSGDSRISGIPKLVVAESSNFPQLANFFVKHVFDPAYNYICRVLEYGIAKGTFQIDDVKMTAYAILSVFHGAVLDPHSLKMAQKYNLSQDAFEKRLCGLILNGILKAK